MSDTQLLDAIRQWDPPSAEELAAQIPGFEVQQLVARGGMSAIYLARQQSLDRAVALKILPPALGRIDGFTERFESEARVLARLRHPAIVTVFDFGLTSEGSAFIAMEWIEGTSLTAWGHGKSLAEKLPVARRLIEAVAYLHQQGVVHADLKPDNVIVEPDGQVRVLDFGLATPFRGGGAAAAPRFGTPPYTAPEAYRAEAMPDPRSDIYSLGQTLCELFAGGRVSGYSDATEIARSIGDRDLAAVLASMIDPFPTGRPTSLDEVLPRMRSAESPARAIPGRRPVIRPAAAPTARPGLSGVKLGASLIAVVAGAVALRHWQASPPAMPSASPPPSTEQAVAPNVPPPAPPSDTAAEAAAIFGSPSVTPTAPPTVPPTAPPTTPPPIAVADPVPQGDPPASVPAPDDPTPPPADRKLRELNERFIAALTREADTIRPNDAKAAAVIQQEVEQIMRTRSVSETDPPDSPESLVKLRRIYQLEKARLGAAGTASTVAVAPDARTPDGRSPDAPSPAPPAPQPKAHLTIYWRCDDRFEFLINGQPAKTEAALETGSPVTSVWKSDVDVSAGDVLGFKLVNTGGARDFAAVVKADGRVLFATDEKWQTTEGEPTNGWWTGLDKKGDIPRKLNSREYINAAVQNFCGFVEIPRGNVLACWGRNPARSNIRRIITKFDVQTALGFRGK